MPRPKGSAKVPGSGRPPGAPNKATADARKAIADFVDGNAHRLVEWLDAVAAGDPTYGRPPDPAKAFDLFQKVIEYHVPRLARQELTGRDGGPVEVKEVRWARPDEIRKS